MIEPRNYSLIAPLYDKIFAGPLEEGHLLIGELIHDNPDKKILEVGIGSGLTLEHVDDHDFTGIDINEEMLYEAQVQALGRHNIQLFQMDAENLRFDDNAFDIVMAPSVLSAVSRPNKVFEEMIRVTRPGGKVVVISNFSDDKKLVSKIFDPFTRSILGFRLDLELDYFKNHRKLKILQVKKINHFASISLSWYLEFEKQS